MRFSKASTISLGLLLGMPLKCLADTPAYQPCPLLRSYYLPPSIDKTSDEVKSFADEFISLFDKLIDAGGSDDFGKITPNTTSFSVVFFSGSEGLEADPVFFEYHHTASEAPKDSTLTSDTAFPLGTLSQLFTVYAWLVEVGDEHWGAAITQFLPELKSAASTGLSITWEQITIGALASHVSGLARDSFACKISEPCSRNAFIEKVSTQSPLFLPDTTPVMSNAAFQVLALALESYSSSSSSSSKNATFGDVIRTIVFEPLEMTHTGLLSPAMDKEIFAQDLNASAVGEPGALSIVSTASDLARAGHAMLSSRLIPKAATRRWFQPVADTSNLRNGVGRPWEIYHAGQYANSSILDVYTKSGLIGHYASYFGLAPDFNVGFAILAHDTEATRGPDLNVYADIASLAIVQLQKLAAAEMEARYAGTFEGPAGSATFAVSEDGPGLVVTSLMQGEVDLRNEIAVAASIKTDDLDFRLYPSNIATETQQQFIAVFQDKSAPVDMGTPTCITWQEVGALGSSVDVRVLFSMDGSGRASNVTLASGSLSLSRSK